MVELVVYLLISTGRYDATVQPVMFSSEVHCEDVKKQDPRFSCVKATVLVPKK